MNDAGCGATMRRFARHRIVPADCQITAIACSGNMTAATCNARAFENINIKSVNPWATA